MTTGVFDLVCLDHFSCGGPGIVLEGGFRFLEGFDVKVFDVNCLDLCVLEVFNEVEGASE